MRILEVRDGFIKVESDEKQSISSFLEIKDSDNKFIAQIVKVSKFDLKYIFIAKLLFLYDGSFNPLRGQNPKKESQITPFSFDLIQESFKTENPMTIGYLNSTETSVLVDKSNLDRKMLVSFDSVNLINRFITNLAKEIVVDEQVLVIDMLGVMDSSAKIKASVDFKLPLNSETLQFMYEDCLNDATSDSKNLIKEIFADLAEYAKSVSFVPFKVLKTIVDDMVDKSHIFKLLVLKNKLAKFDKEGYFAVTQNELDSIEKITKLKSAVIDLSILNPQFQNRYLTSIYNELIRQDYCGRVILLASNAIDKKNIKCILQSKVKSTFITHSRFRFLNEFKSLFTNYLIEATFSNKEVFKPYSMIMNNMTKDSLLLVGDSTNFVPLVLDIPVVEDSLFDDVIELEFDSNVSEVAVSDAILYEVELSADSQTIAIEKKSEDLIEKLAEEIEQEPPSNLFVEEDEEIISAEELEEGNLEDESDEISQSFKGENEFHTVVNAVTIDSLDKDLEEDVETEEAPVDSQLADVVEEDKISDFAEEVVDLPEELNSESSDTEEAEQEEYSNEDVSTEEIEYPSELLDMVEEKELPEDIVLEQVSEEDLSEDVQAEIIQDDYDNEDTLDSIDQIDYELDSIVDLEEDEYDSDGDIVAVDITDTEDETLNKEIIEDVDKVFTTMKDESLSESDLDLIDELNEDVLEDQFGESDSILSETDMLETENLDSNFEEIVEYSEDELEESFIEPLEEFSGELENDLQEEINDVLETKPLETPIVPVYEAEIPNEDKVVSDPIEQGDTVSHAKYGVGVVEKMIKYGSKTLFSINFDNVGRRLLDPTLTEIKKA